MDFRCASDAGRFQTVATGSNWPIMLKKSASVSTTEKYAPETVRFAQKV